MGEEEEGKRKKEGGKKERKKKERKGILANHKTKHSRQKHTNV